MSEDINVFSEHDETEILNRVNLPFSPVMSTDDIQSYYENWTELYENDLAPGRYNGPRYAADFVDRNCMEDKSQARILDIAAGTGLVAEELVKKGFNNIDALDPCAKLLEIAKTKYVYKQYICEFLTGDKTSIQNNTYDFVVCSGGFGHGHIPIEALYEIARVTKIGGTVVIVMREEYIHVDYYKGRFRRVMKDLEADGRWKEIDEKIVQNYFADKPGIVFVFRVLQ